MRYFAGLCVAMCLMSGVQKVQAEIVFEDNFDSYEGQAAFEAVWTPIGCTGQGSSCTGNVSSVGGTLSTDQSSTGISGKSVFIHSPVGSPGTSDSSQRNQAQFSATPTLTAGDQIIFSYDFYDIAQNTTYRQFANLQTVAQPTLTNQLVTMGLTNSLTAFSDGGDRYMGRILGYSGTATDPDGGPADTLAGGNSVYFKLNDTSVPVRTSGWHNLKAIISTDDGQSTDYAFYIDNALAETVSNVGNSTQLRTYEYIRLGAGVSSTQDAYYDNFKVEFIAAGSQTGVPGDYNGNNTVDAADYALWRNGGPLQNEVDEPGTVNAIDYTEWRSRFGNNSGSGSGLQAGAVPEPAVILSMVIGAAAFSCFARRRG